MKTTPKQADIQTPEKRCAKAKAKYIRIAPRKMRGVINAIRYQHPEKALHMLASVNKKAARLTEKVLKTAIANAKVLGLDANRLTISDIRADGGPSMKRFMERSMGRGDRILKRMTHLSIILTEGWRSFNTESPLQAQAETQALPKAAKAEKAAKGKKKAAAGQPVRQAGAKA